MCTCTRALKTSRKSSIMPWSFIHRVSTAGSKREQGTSVTVGADAVARWDPDYAASVRAAFELSAMSTLCAAVRRNPLAYMINSENLRGPS